MTRVSVSPWARESLSPLEMAEVADYARAHRVVVDIRYSRRAIGYVAVVDGREGVDQRRPINAFRKAAGTEIVSVLS